MNVAVGEFCVRGKYTVFFHDLAFDTSVLLELTFNTSVLHDLAFDT